MESAIAAVAWLVNAQQEPQESLLVHRTLGLVKPVPSSFRRYQPMRFRRRRCIPRKRSGVFERLAA